MVKKVWEGMLCNHSDHKILTLLHMLKHMHMFNTLLVYMLAVCTRCTYTAIHALPELYYVLYCSLDHLSCTCTCFDPFSYSSR